jgi:hypothetical protein
MPYLAVAGGVYTVVILKVDLSGGGGVKPVSVGMARTDLEREQATSPRRTSPATPA